MSDPVPSSAIYDATVGGLSVIVVTGGSTGDVLVRQSDGTYTPAALSKSSVGLGNVDNTSDANKPVSTSQQTALDAKQATLVSGTNIKTVNSTSLLGSGDITVSASPGGSSGQVQWNSSGSFSGAAAVVYATTVTHVTMTAQGATIVPLCVKGAASQSGNLFEWRSSAGALRGAISAAGTLLLTQGDQYGCTLQNANFGPGNGILFDGSAPFRLVSNNAVAGRLNTGGNLELFNSIMLSDTTAPATATSTGAAGEVRFDANYMYRCVATNTWKRVALSTW